MRCCFRSGTRSRSLFALALVLFFLPGGRDCLSLSALSESVTHKVYRYLEHLTLNLVTSPVFLILTERASFLRAVRRKSLISCICFGCDACGG